MDPMGSPEWHIKNSEAMRDGALGYALSPHKYSLQHSGAFASGAESAERSKQLTEDYSNVSWSSGDGVGAVVFLGGTVLSFMVMLETQNPAVLGGGLLLSTVSCLAIKLAIDTSENKEALEVSTKQKLHSNENLNISSKVAYVINRLQKHVDQGTLKDYLENDGAIKIKSFEDLSYRDPKNRLHEPNDRITKLITRINNHLKAGTLERSLKKNSEDAQKLRAQWNDLLLLVPHKTKKQIQLEKEKAAFKRNVIKSSLVNIASFAITASLLTGIAVSAFTTVAGNKQCVTSDVGVNIRTEPSSWQQNETVITRLPFNSTVQTRVPKVNGDWYRATTTNDGQTITGYVHSDYVGKCAP